MRAPDPQIRSPDLPIQKRYKFVHDLVMIFGHYIAEAPIIQKQGGWWDKSALNGVFGYRALSGVFGAG